MQHLESALFFMFTVDFLLAYKFLQRHKWFYNNFIRTIEDPIKRISQQTRHTIVINTV